MDISPMSCWDCPVLFDAVLKTVGYSSALLFGLVIVWLRKWPVISWIAGLLTVIAMPVELLLIHGIARFSVTWHTQFEPRSLIAQAITMVVWLAALVAAVWLAILVDQRLRRPSPYPLSS